MTKRERRRLIASAECGTIKEEIAFHKGARWADATMVERLRELKSDYEKDLDAEPRIYERHIQLCSKISLIEKLILELEDK